MTTKEQLVPTTLEAFEPSTTELADGGHLVVWSGLDGGFYGVWAQRYNAAGNEVGDIYQISSGSLVRTNKPEVTTLSNDKVLVTWSAVDSASTTVQYDSFMARILSPTGELGDDAFEISDTPEIGGGCLPIRDCIARWQFRCHLVFIQWYPC